MLNTFPEQIQNDNEIDKNHLITNKNPQIKIKNWILSYATGNINISLIGEIFTFYNPDNTIIGNISFEDIMNYVSERLDIVNEVTKKLIESTICITTKNGTHTLITSPFMTNIDILFALNNIIKLNDDKILINKNIRLFVINLLEHTLNIIATISKKVNDAQDDNNKFKNKLVKYSVGIVFRLTQYISKELVDNNIQYDKMLLTLESFNLLENELKNTITTLKQQ